MSDDDDCHVKGTGKWREPGVPHRGWSCVDVYDDREDEDDDGEGELTFVCQMCEVQRIRYVHVMQHPDYPDELHVGCICAGNMEQDLVGARQRETNFRKRRSRKSKWLTRDWRTSVVGNEFINTDGYNIVVYPKAGAGWGARVKHRVSGRERVSKLPYANAAQAKLAAFEVMLDMKRKLPDQDQSRS